MGYIMHKVRHCPLQIATKIVYTVMHCLGDSGQKSHNDRPQLHYIA